MRWQLRVVYPTGHDGYYWGELDPRIVNAVGKLDTSRSAESDLTRRVLRFGFGSEPAARRARQRVLNLHLRGLRTSVERA